MQTLWDRLGSDYIADTGKRKKRGIGQEAQSVVINSPAQAPLSPEARVQQLNTAMAGLNLFGGVQRPLQSEQNSTFRLAPEPFFLEPEIIDRLEALGPAFLAFYKAANRLYQQSVRGTIPSFFHEYLDIGKPERVLEYGRLNRFKHDVPVVIRPDVLLTDTGMAISELDSVPGGMGLLSFLMREYSKMGYGPVGGMDGMITHFDRALRNLRPEVADPFVAIVVSDESEDYRGEMIWLAEALQKGGLRAQVCHPKDLAFRDDALYLPTTQGDVSTEPVAQKVDVLYRFFELFDLKNIPQIELILYAIRKEMVAVTPPLKSQLEEKLLFALFHHPVLEDAWRKELGPEMFAALRQVLPASWVVDARPLPPHAVIPNLTIGKVPVTDFRQLVTASQRERELVLKPSGFSPEAWGARGLTIGHDVSAEEWAHSVDTALAAFTHTPYVLQQFHKARKDAVSYYDFDTHAIRRMYGRARLCPYYMVTGDTVHLSGVLATVVPLNKKAIHGMVDAVMVPVAAKGDQGGSVIEPNNML
jgi:hypothetical protein